LHRAAGHNDLNGNAFFDQQPQQLDGFVAGDAATYAKNYPALFGLTRHGNKIADQSGVCKFSPLIPAALSNPGRCDFLSTNVTAAPPFFQKLVEKAPQVPIAGINRVNAGVACF
jgi:hypothetical protein